MLIKRNLCSLYFVHQLKNRGKANHCFDYNPTDENAVVGERVILYPCHGMGQNQVTTPLLSQIFISLSENHPVGVTFPSHLETKAIWR